MAQFEDHSEFGHSLLHDRQARSFGQICGRFTPKVPSGPRPLRIHKRGDDGESYLVNQCHVKREGGWLGKDEVGGVGVGVADLVPNIARLHVLGSWTVFDTSCGWEESGGEHKSPAVVVDEFLAVMTMFRGWKPIRVPCWARWMLAGGWCGVGLIAFSHICEERKYGRTFHIWPAWLGASACFTCGRPYKLFWCFYLSAAAYGPLTSLHSRVVDSCQATTLPSTQTPRIFFLLLLLPDSLFKAFNL